MNKELNKIMWVLGFYSDINRCYFFLVFFEFVYDDFCVFFGIILVINK